MLTPLESAGDTREFEAVVIGASAGGVDALATLLSALPASFGAAVIVVLHLPANNESLLPRVLAHHSALPLREASDKESVDSATVHVAPPGYHLLVEPGRTFALSIDEPVHFSRPSLDVLFESAAHTYRDALLGIVLTGANADGAEGLAVIRELGGAAWVQAPETAYASAMPEAAIAVAGADRILPLNEMAAQLAQLTTRRIVKT